MALSDLDTAELTSLRGARTLLLSGRLPAKVVYNGQEIDYAKIDPARLEARIAALETQQAAASITRRRGAVGFRL